VKRKNRDHWLRAGARGRDARAAVGGVMYSLTSRRPTRRSVDGPVCGCEPAKMELKTIEAFHGAVRAGRIIVITDDATGDHAHRHDCSWVRDEYFKKKVIENGGRNGGYFAVGSLDEARRAHGAAPCGTCSPI
jgi:hypothetical protein